MSGPAPSEEQITQERKVLELRRAGYGMTEVSRQLGMPLSTVKARYKAALARTLREPAAAVRDLEADRLDRLQAAIWNRAIKGELDAIDRVLKIHDKRVELLGLAHRHGVAERAQRIEFEKLRLMALTLGRALDEAGLDPETRARVEQVMFAQMREVAAEDAVEAGPAEPGGEPPALEGPADGQPAWEPPS
jgi:hypothetical protein